MTSLESRKHLFPSCLLPTNNATDKNRLACTGSMNDQQSVNVSHQSLSQAVNKTLSTCRTPLHRDDRTQIHNHVQIPIQYHRIDAQQSCRSRNYQLALTVPPRHRSHPLPAVLPRSQFRKTSKLPALVPDHPSAPFDCPVANHAGS